MSETRPYVLVSSLTPEDASTTLFFGHLRDRAPLRLAPASTSDLAGASAMVVVRALFEFDRLAVCAKWLGVPRYYFVDDNFIVLREDAGVADARWFKDYSIERVRTALNGFAGVLLATPSLVDYFREHRLHPRTMLFPPVGIPILAGRAPRADRSVTVGFFGGLHRREPFRAYVYPALRRLARSHAIRLVAAGIDRGDLDADAKLPVEFVRYHPSYTEGLQAMAEQGIDVLVHPGTHHAHNAFKNTHVLINAQALGAVPIFSPGAPYDTIANDGVALIAENTEAAWSSALARVITDLSLRESLRARLAEYCDVEFSGQRNRDVIASILRDHPAPTTGRRSTRLLLGVPCQGLSLGQHVVTRALARLA